jgi:hypothetical protein
VDIAEWKKKFTVLPALLHLTLLLLVLVVVVTHDFTNFALQTLCCKYCMCVSEKIHSEGTASLLHSGIPVSIVDFIVSLFFTVVTVLKKLNHNV